MSQYKDFAQIYDILMDNKDYDLWVENIEKIYKKNDFNPRKILELGCGTGNITTRLHKKGYSIIGTDISEDMLEIANIKSMEENLRIKFLKQDMVNITYNKKVDSVISICDGINYVTKLEDLDKVFKGVFNILKDDGLFIFDISTIYKLENIVGNNTFNENFEDFSYIWDNEYSKESRLLEFELTLFLLEDENLFSRYIETHKQRAHSISEIKKLLSEKFNILEILNENLNEIKEKDERIYFIAKKEGK